MTRNSELLYLLERTRVELVYSRSTLTQYVSDKGNGERAAMVKKIRENLTGAITELDGVIAKLKGESE